MGGQLNLLRPSADIESCVARVRLRGKSGRAFLLLHMSAFGGKADIALGSSPLGF